MALFRTNRPGSWTILSAAVVIAAVSWGAYAWRHARPSGTADDAAQLAESGNAIDQESLVQLRATRPARPAVFDTSSTVEAASEADEVVVREPEGVSRAVTANVPPSSTEPVEMTLLRRNVTDEVADGDAAFGGSPLLRSARAASARGELVVARKQLTEALHAGLSAVEEADVRRELTRIADALLFSRATNLTDPLTDVHEVAPGDSLYMIARKYQITEDLLASINGLDDPNRLRVGQRLKVIRGPFHAVISKTHHRMDLYLDDVLVRSYRVGLGTNGGTPTGTWAVNTKLKNPDWTDPITNQHYLADDPDNPIGERWIGLEGLAGEAVGKVGFGIHGTIDPASIGENMSMGCIRLIAEDVAAVYDLLVDRHSRVVVNP